MPRPESPRSQPVATRTGFFEETVWHLLDANVEHVLRATEADFSIEALHLRDEDANEHSLYVASRTVRPLVLFGLTRIMSVRALKHPAFNAAWSLGSRSYALESGSHRISITEATNNPQTIAYGDDLLDIDATIPETEDLFHQGTMLQLQRDVAKLNSFEPVTPPGISEAASKHLSRYR